MSRVIHLARIPASLRRRIRQAETGQTPPPRTSHAQDPAAHDGRPADILFLSQGDFTPHDILWAAVNRRWPDRAMREYAKMVPGRKIRGDIAFPDDRLVVEVDGWRYHGKYLTDFRRDRERQNLLTIAGWRILRFTAGAIRIDTNACCALIALALTHEERDGQ